MDEKRGFRRCFEGKNFFNVIFVCEDSKERFCRLYGAIFQFYVQKSPEDAEDVNVSDLCGPARPHPIRCLFACNGLVDKPHPRF